MSLLTQLYLPRPMSPDIYNIGDSGFGIFRLTTSAFEQVPQFKYLRWIIIIDESGSISNSYKDNKTKAQHIQHTLNCLFDYFNCLTTQYGIDQILTIVFFDNNTREYSFDLMQSGALQAARDIATLLVANRTTNIEKALNRVNKIMSLSSDLSSLPSYTGRTQDKHCRRIINILMTDGHITSGNQSYSYLQELVKQSTYYNQAPGIQYSFIGYDIDHNYLLLEQLANAFNDTLGPFSSDYYCIDNYDNAGIVYGEIAFNGVYQVMHSIQINVHNGEIYDFKNNQWKSSINVSSISANTTRTWHIRKTSKQHTTLTLTYKSWSSTTNTHNESNITITPEYINSSDHELINYYWRQKTLEFLALAKSVLNTFDVETSWIYQQYYCNCNLASHVTLINDVINDNNENDNNENDNNENDNNEDNNILHKQMQELIDSIKDYKTKLNHENISQYNEFLQNLCDDLHTAIVATDIPYGYQYIQMRQLSQGLQRVYNASDLNNIDSKSESDSGIQPLISQTPISVYKNSLALNVIRMCSQHLDDFVV